MSVYRTIGPLVLLRCIQFAVFLLDRQKLHVWSLENNIQYAFPKMKETILLYSSFASNLFFPRSGDRYGP